MREKFGVGDDFVRVESLNEAGLRFKDIISYLCLGWVMGLKIGQWKFCWRMWLRWYLKILLLEGRSRTLVHDLSMDRISRGS